MSESFLSSPQITVTKLNQVRQHVQCTVQFSEDQSQETVSLAVIIPSAPTDTLDVVQQKAIRRAIEILRGLSDPS